MLLIAITRGHDFVNCMETSTHLKHIYLQVVFLFIRVSIVILTSPATPSNVSLQTSHDMSVIVTSSTYKYGKLSHGYAKRCEFNIFNDWQQKCFATVID